jgi:hypothetical protein
MELAIANQRDRFCVFRGYYAPADGQIKSSCTENERPFTEAGTKLFFEVNPTARKTVLATLFSK